MIGAPAQAQAQAPLRLAAAEGTPATVPRLLDTEALLRAKISEGQMLKVGGIVTVITGAMMLVGGVVLEVIGTGASRDPRCDELRAFGVPDCPISSWNGQMLGGAALELMGYGGIVTGLSLLISGSVQKETAEFHLSQLSIAPLVGSNGAEGVIARV